MRSQLPGIHLLDRRPAGPEFLPFQRTRTSEPGSGAQELDGAALRGDVLRHAAPLGSRMDRMRPLPSAMPRPSSGRGPNPSSRRASASASRPCRTAIARARRGPSWTHPAVIDDAALDRHLDPATWVHGRARCWRDRACASPRARRISVRTGRQVPVQLPSPDPAPDRRAVDPEPPRQLRLRNALLEMLLLQHPGLPSVHPCPFPSVVTSSPQRPGTSRSNKPKLLHFRLPQMLDLQLPPTPAAQSRC